MLKCGYLKNENFYIEKSFIVNEATKYIKHPSCSFIIQDEEVAKKIIYENIDTSIILNTFINIEDEYYNLIVTDNYLLLSGIMIKGIRKEETDENKIKIMKYYRDLMENKISTINEMYYLIYDIFKEENVEKEKKVLKKIRY